MQTWYINSPFLPVAFAIAGLVIFILGQFARGRLRMILSIAGVLFAGLFFYALAAIRNNPGTTGSNSLVSIYGILGVTLVLEMAGKIAGIIGLILWLYATLRIVFTGTIPEDARKTLLAAAALLIFVNLPVTYVLGHIIGSICFPVTTIGFFIIFRRYGKGLQGG